MYSTGGESFGRLIVELLLYQPIESDAVVYVIAYSMLFLEIAAVACILAIILKDENLRRRSGQQDRLFFIECMLVLCYNLLCISRDTFLPHISMLFEYSVMLIREVLYLMIALQWLVCVDYSLYRSMDHIRRHYFHAVIPVIVITVMDIVHSYINQFYYYTAGWAVEAMDLLFILKLMIVLGYFAAAVYLVRKHEKFKLEPRFLRLSVFIVPFLIGALFRFSTGPMTALGVILTYRVLKRRERYIDYGTGLYNSGYLDCISAHWDKKGILKTNRIHNAFAIMLGEGRYLLLTGYIRESAMKMAEQMIMEEASEASPPFEPQIHMMQRREGQSMKEMASEIKSIGGTVL